MRALLSRRLLPSIAALVLLAAGAVGALAANAELPDEASDTARSQLADLNADENGDDDTNGDDTNGDLTDLDVPDPTHGEVVSTFAQETELEGCERGQAIASVARGDATPEEAETADYSDPCDNGDDGEIELEGDENGNGNGDDDTNGDDENGDANAGTAGEDNRGDHDEEFGRTTADERSGGRSGGPDADDED